MMSVSKSIWVTHCSREKNAAFETSGEKTTPDQLYTSPGLQRFVQYCNDHHHDWAIFSDNYGVVFPEEKIRWYNKPPSTVTPEEFEKLVDSLITRLKGFDQIYFHHRPGETHPVFEGTVKRAKAAGLNVVELTLEDMERGE